MSNRRNKNLAAFGNLLGQGLLGMMTGMQMRQSRQSKEAELEFRRKQEERLNKSAEYEDLFNAARAMDLLSGGGKKTTTEGEVSDRGYIMSLGLSPDDDPQSIRDALQKRYEELNAPPSDDTEGFFRGRSTDPETIRRELDALRRSMGRYASPKKKSVAPEGFKPPRMKFFGDFMDRTMKQMAPQAQPQQTGQAAVDSASQKSLLRSYASLLASSDPTAPGMDMVWQQLGQAFPSRVPQRLRDRWQSNMIPGAGDVG